MVELTLSHILPFSLGGGEEMLHLFLTSLVAALKKLSKLGINFSIGLDDNLDVEVVHHI
mgnify:CR=1 FL=1